MTVTSEVADKCGGSVCHERADEVVAVLNDNRSRRYRAPWANVAAHRQLPLTGTYGSRRCRRRSHKSAQDTPQIEPPAPPLHEIS